MSETIVVALVFARHRPLRAVIVGVYRGALAPLAYQVALLAGAGIYFSNYVCLVRLSPVIALFEFSFKHRACARLLFHSHQGAVCVGIVQPEPTSSRQNVP